eukprot:UN09118
MLRQAASGVWNLHRMNFIHRDLALRNLLIGLDSFRVVVTDFGLSRVMDDTPNNTTKGRFLPIAWCAPECLKSLEYSKKSDIWAFAVMCWEMFTEEIP